MRAGPLGGGFGRTLLVKPALFVPLLLIGALHLPVVRPALQGMLRGTPTMDSTGMPWRSLRHSIQRTFAGAVALETLFGAAILLVVGYS